MKPLPSAPITSEDFSAWLVGRPGWWSVLFVLSIAADRRDAALMRRVQYQRQWLPASGNVPALPPWLLPVEWECGPVGGQL